MVLVVQAQAPRIHAAFHVPMLQDQIATLARLHNSAVIENDIPQVDTGITESLYTQLREAMTPVRHAMRNSQQEEVRSLNLLGHLRRARQRANDSAAHSYLRNCVTALEVERDPVTEALPQARSCEDATLGNFALSPPEAVLYSRVLVQDADVYRVYVVSATGTMFSFDFEQTPVLDEVTITPTHLRATAKLYLEQCARAIQVRYPDKALMDIVRCSDIVPDIEVRDIHLLLRDGVILWQGLTDFQVSVVDITGEAHSRSYHIDE